MTTLRRVLAVLIGLRGLGNCLKALGTGSGLVVLGRLLPPDTWLAPALGAAMVAYAAGLWAARPFALPLGIAYAAFVTANLILFPRIAGLPAGIAPWMYAVYGIVGAGVAWLAVAVLVRDLRRGRGGGR
jgi:hypothetical protein